MESEGAIGQRMRKRDSNELFPTTLPERSWEEFSAEGFSGPVVGAVYRAGNPPVCGMPLGGIDTGCVDIEVSGLLGFSTLFNMIVPRRGPINQPFLGVAVGTRTWVLTTLDLRGRRGETALPTVYNLADNAGNLAWRNVNRRTDILNASEVHYWGHYPVADMEFETSAPVQVGLRAWSPFIPGDVGAANTPGAVFEVHLRNTSEEEQQGTLAFSFPGPDEEEAGTTRASRQDVADGVRGLHVTCNKASYVLGALDEEGVRTGGYLGSDASAWGHIRVALPRATEQVGGSVAVDFTVSAGAEKIVRFVMTWYSPDWKGGGSPDAGGNTYTHMYASRYGGPVEVARFLAANHVSLLKRILAWQSVIYADQGLPAWLRSSLIDNLHLIAEDGLWAQAKAPIGEWCREEDGLFGMIESPRWAAQVECNPCSFYGNMPLVYLFPELALSTLRGYKAYQYPDGQAPWIFGGASGSSLWVEMAMPVRGYGRKSMATLDGACYVDMVDRMWMRTGDDSVLHEFYESVKRNTIFTMNLRPGSGAAGIVSLPTDNDASDWMESTQLYGIVPHVGGIHLAQLRMAGRMAEAIGDRAFAQQCREWLEAGSAVMEEHTWAGDSYLLYHEVETDKKSNVVMGCQLDGEWMTRFHGLPGVFLPEHVGTTLATLRRTSIAEARGDGSVIFAPPPPERESSVAFGPDRGSRVYDPTAEPGVSHEGETFDTGYWLQRAIHPPGTMILAMTYMYNGQYETGIDLLHQLMTVVMEMGWSWDFPVGWEGGTRARQCGFDYYQNCMLWSVPAAIAGTDLGGPCKTGGLVDRMIQAAG